VNRASRELLEVFEVGLAPEDDPRQVIVRRQGPAESAETKPADTDDQFEERSPTTKSAPSFITAVAMGVGPPR
jgi:hypothetical protein